MTRVQKLQLKQSELRSKIADELDKAATEREDGVLEDLTAQARTLEVELRAALVAESESDAPADTETPNEPEGGEQREYREMLDQALVTDYFREQDGVKVDGASRELREHAMGSDRIGYIPIDILLEGEERELRADAVSNIDTAIQDNQQSIAGRLFQRSDAMYLGAMMPTVAVGTVTYPRLTGGTSGYAPKLGVARDAGAATLESKSITPQRLTASYVWNLETLAKIRGWESALRQDLREVMNDKLDELILNGQAAETDNDGTDNEKFAGLLNTLTAGSDVGAGAVDWKRFFSLYDDLVDGLLAYSDMDIALLVGVDTWKAFQPLEVGTNGNSGLLRDRIPRDRWRLSKRIAAKKSKKQQTLARLSVPDRVRGLYVPTWRGMEVITDPYTRAAHGERKVTATMIVGSEIIDARAYSLRSVVLDA